MVKIYWQRFLSRTPKALKKLQLFLTGLFVVVGGAIESMKQFDIEDPIIDLILKRSLIIIPFMVFVLQFATSDTTLQNTTDEGTTSKN